MAGPIYIQRDEVELEGDRALIGNSALTDIYHKDVADAVALLSEVVSPVNVDEVRIDEDGRITVSDHEFSQVLERRLNRRSALEVKNLGCGGGC